jgi:hypothetical protein
LKATVRFQRVLPIVLTLLIALVTVRPARAQLNLGPSEYAKIVAHVVPYSQAGSRPCTSSKAAVPCEDMVVKGGLFPDAYYLFVVVTDGDREGGIAGVEFGIDYNGANRQGVDLYSWASCGTMEFPMAGWPAPGTGTLVTWDSENKCQRDEPGGAGTGVMAVAGYFYVAAYSSDKFKLTVRSNSGFAKVASCEAEENIVEGSTVHFTNSHLGYVSFSENAQDAGYNPCGLSKPKEETTWSDVKSRSH